MKKYFAVLLLLTACQPMRANTNSPVIDAQSGVANGNISFNVESEFGGNEYITARSSDGEFYKGKVITSSQTSSGGGSYTSYEKNSAGKLKPHTEYDNYNQTTYSSSARAVLIGDAGHSMDCDFTLSDPEFGLAGGGGVGSCRISDGRTIPVNIESKNGFFKYR